MDQIAKNTSVQVKSNRYAFLFTIAYQMFFVLLFLLFFDTKLGPSGSMNMVIMLSQFPGFVIIFLFEFLLSDPNRVVGIIIIVLFQGVLLFLISKIIIKRLLREKEENEFYDSLRE